MQVERAFSPGDLTAFAELSGDFNPLHTDPVAARRTQFGECVAHGVLVLMWALDCLQAQSTPKRRWEKISARFLRPVPTGLKVGVTIKEKSPDEILLMVGESGRTLLQCDVTWVQTDSTAPISSALDIFPPREVPVQACIETKAPMGEAIDLYWPVKSGQQMFPELAKTQSPDSLSVLLAATRVIGMRVPGEHSVFLQIEMTFAPHPEIQQPLMYRVAEFRKSSQRLGVAIAGSAGQGMLWALVAQTDMATVKQRIPRERFLGRRVIVIGGSRGLGEIAAKVLTAGGAEVILSYRVGSDDASRVVADIAAHGGRANAFQLDASNTDWENKMEANCTQFDHLCYFPTPPIVGGDGCTFNVELFEKFCAVYVAGFIKVAQWFAKQNVGRFSLFNASTVYVETPPLRNLEYAAAKAAAEACCRWIAAAYPQSRVYVARFPRLNTDQTASFLSAGEHDNLETMFAELSAWLSV